MKSESDCVYNNSKAIFSVDWELFRTALASDYERQMIRNYIDQDQQVPPIYGDPLFQYGFGIQNFGEPSSIVSLEKEEQSVWVYPSVFDNGFNVKLSDLNKIQYLEVIDINGRLIRREDKLSDNLYLDLPNSPSGLYLLRVVGSNNIQIIKLIKRN